VRKLNQTKQTSLRLDPGLLAQLDEQAARNRRNRSDMVRVMIEDWIEENSRKIRKEKTA
jgi:metal-responsive CopG/Arc/MetJ family transcriptional regulator